MIKVSWSTPATAEQKERLAAKCAIAMQAADRLYQQDQQLAAAAPVAAGEMILMSAENPDGQKLEELLGRVRREIEAETRKMYGGEYEASADGQRRMLVRSQVRENNMRITCLLLQAETIQRETLALLATLGSDPGPRGTPRI